MQKKLIALAVAGLVSGAAFAQSNVTVYGVVDAYYAHVNASGQPSQNAINSGGLAGSRIGFKGVEDLGNGLKALFVLEYGLNVDGNSGIGGDFSARSGSNNGWGVGVAGYNGQQTGNNNSARQQILGLTGGFGTVAAGYAQTTGYDWACAVDPLAGGALDTTSRLPGQLLLNCGKGGRSSNAIAYISPSFGGFTIAVNAGLGENANGGNNADRAMLLSGTYSNGPLLVGLVYSKADAKSGLLTSGSVFQGSAGTVPLALGSSVKELGLGATYDFGVAKLFASYQTLDYSAVGGKDKTYQIGVSAPVGPGALVASYAKVKLDEIDQLLSKNFDDKSYAIAYVYGLSKRTSLYGGYNRYKTGADSTRQVTEGVAPTAGGSVGTFGIGVNHKF